MSKRKDKRIARMKLLELTRPNDFYQVSNGSLYFQKIMNRYKKSKKQNIIFPDINSLISDYRTEKIKTFSESEVIKDELGDEVRKFKALQSITNPQRLSVKNASENTDKNIYRRIKENRKSLIITLQKFERKGKILIPENKKENIKPDLNPKNILYHRKTILEKKQKRKESMTESYNSFEDTEQANTKNSLPILNQKIDYMAKDVINDSENLRTTYSKHIKLFTTRFDNWKTIQEFKHPEFKIRNKKNKTIDDF